MDVGFGGGAVSIALSFSISSQAVLALLLGDSWGFLKPIFSDVMDSI